jgi:hypothetical protein
VLLCSVSLNMFFFVVVDMLPQIFLAVQVQVDELNVKCNKETVLLLRKLALDNKVCV